MNTPDRQVLRKVAWRLIPFLCLLYIFNILDRVNLGFARLTMQDDLGLSKSVFDLGYGMFYVGYLVFEVPSNLLLRRVGARRWIARIMVSWGIVTCATMFVQGPVSFYILRILLGVAEAGFFPGIILYLTYWFPDRDRARVVALFMVAISFAGILGNPLSGWIMQHMKGTAGLTGWQWIFLLEGLPSVLLGLSVLFVLPDGPAQAHWLSAEERDWLVNKLRREEHDRRLMRKLREEKYDGPQRHGSDLLKAMTSPRVWLLICLYSTVAVGANAAGSYYPTLIENRFSDYSTDQIGLLSALPHVCSFVGMILFGMSSDRTGERSKHVAFAAFLAAAGWMISATTSTPWVALAGLCLAQAGMMSMLPVFWAMPTAFLSGVAAAGGIALINSVGNIGGFLGPTILGQFGLESMSVTLIVGGILALLVQPAKPRVRDVG